MKKEVLKSLLFVAAFSTVGQASYVAANAADTDIKQSGHPSEHQMVLRRRTVDDKQQLLPEEMLSDLRDTRLSVGQVKQQAVNLFLEATRVVVKPGDPALHFSPTTISAEMLSEKKNYMPPRKDWLVFYMNTLEPIVQLLTDDIHDVDTNGRAVPPNIEAKINPLWKSWQSDVRAINKSLDDLQELIGPDSGTNIPIAKTALAIYDKAVELEKVRYNAYELMSKEYVSMEQHKASGH
ncbi:MAG: hypothetical protein DKT66_08385 [Candidatus Melainabacteria bacterium]|nr:MAG: hypothetical protein DKT66_08385 [Candidatus Melainabacteria bacterium]